MERVEAGGFANLVVPELLRGGKLAPRDRALVTDLVFLWDADGSQARRLLVLVMVALWAIRLSAYLTLRNAGQPEDRRYGEEGR